MLIIQRNRRRLPNHGIKRKRQHGRNRNSLGSRLHVKDLSGDDPRQRAARRAEAKVEQPRHDDEAPCRALVVVVPLGRELRHQDRRDDKGQHVAQVAEDERPATARVVDEHHAQELRDERNDGGDGLVPQRLIRRNAQLRINVHAEILNRTHTRHLHRRLQRARKE